MKGTRWTAGDRIDERGEEGHYFVIQPTFISQCNYFRMYIPFERDDLNSVHQNQKPTDGGLMHYDTIIPRGLNQ
jgi:hypothetical protein